MIFGVTGDLTNRKLVPALYDLACHGVLPEAFTIVGYGRKPLDDGSFQAMLSQAIDDFYGTDAVEGACCRRILRAPRYVQGAFDDLEGFRKLGAILDEIESHAATGGNRAFYLATPPSLFGTIIGKLGESGLARRGAFGTGAPAHSAAQGWTRLVIEKPFGRDLQTARDLNAFVDTVFDERQVYRIDHYLAKETVQNLLVFRFANGIFEPIWNRRYVDHVQITAAETLGVEHRGPYYEETGALRDMVHNAPDAALHAGGDGAAGRLRRRGRARREGQGAARHASHPAGRGRPVRGARPVRRRRRRRAAGSGLSQGGGGLADLAAPRPTSRSSSSSTTGAGRGCRSTCAPASAWPSGSPRSPSSSSGRRSRCSVPRANRRVRWRPNVLVMRVQPDEGFSLSVESKVPGQEIALQTVEMEYAYGSALNELPFSAYETVLIDLMEGDATLFNRGDQVEEAWRGVGPILEAWQTAPKRGIPTYEAGSWGPEAADALIARDGRSWRQP